MIYIKVINVESEKIHVLLFENNSDIKCFQLQLITKKNLYLLFVMEQMALEDLNKSQ